MYVPTYNVYCIVYVWLLTLGCCVLLLRLGRCCFVLIEGERTLEARRAAMRSCGVGDGDVNAEPEPVTVTEKEVKTVYIEPEKPEQRNVGLQVRPVNSTSIINIEISVL